MYSTRRAGTWQRFRSWSLLALLGVTNWCGKISAAPTLDLVELPPVLVTDEIDLPPWRYVTLPGLEVLSRWPDTRTLAFIRSRDRALQVLKTILPADLMVTFSAPQVILISSPVGAPETARSLVGANGSAVKTDRPAVRYLANLSLDDRDVSMTYVMQADADFDRQNLRASPDLMRLLLERRVPALPRWFIEGFLSLYGPLPEAQPFEWVDLKKRRVDFADTSGPLEFSLPTPWLSAADGNRLMAAMPALGTLLDWQTNSDVAKLNDLRAVQAALFVRWGLEANRGAHRKAFWDFVRQSARQPVSEETFRQSFGLRFAETESRLKDFLDLTRDSPVSVKVPRLVDPVVPRPRLATPGEIARLTADWERLEVSQVRQRQPEFLPQYLVQLERTLDRAAEAHVNDPGFLAVHALIQIDLGHSEAALPLLEQAIQASVPRSRVYLEFARLSLVETAGPDRVAFSPKQLDRILTPLDQARQLKPALPETYRILGTALLRSPSRLSPERLATLAEGCQLFPRDAGMLYTLAALQAQHDYRTEAAVTVAASLRLPLSAEQRRSFEQLQAILAQLPR